MLWLNKVQFIRKKSQQRLPATHPVMKHAALPAIIALRTMVARSDFRVGANAPSAPNKIPMEPKLENPHKAYVATTSDLVCKQIFV